MITVSVKSVCLTVFQGSCQHNDICDIYVFDSCARMITIFVASVCLMAVQGYS